MDDDTLLQNLVTARSDAERRAMLNAGAPLPTTFFQALKALVRDLVEKDSREALRVAEIGLEAAELAAEEEGVAHAWWARGNALLFVGRYDDCIAAYSTAISLLSSLGLAEEVAQLQTNTMLPLMWTGRHAEALVMGRSALATLADQGTSRQVANLYLNLGICSLHQADYAQAVEQTHQAAQVFAAHDDAVQAARCRVTQAIALEYLDRFAEAESLLQGALVVLAGHEAWVPWARAALNLGILYARLADHQRALSWLEDSRRAFLEAGIEMDTAVVDLYRVECFLDLNLLPEAAALSAGLVDTFTQLKMPRQVARSVSLLAQVYARKGQPQLALQEVARARRIFDAQGDSTEMALLDLQRATLLHGMGRWGEALHLASEVAAALDVERHPLRHAEAHLLVAACCEELGRIEEAQVAYRVAWEAGSHPTATTEPPPMLAYRIAHARGTIAEAAGEWALARGEYGRAVGYLGRIAEGLGLDELRGGYLVDKRAVYESALRLALSDGRLADAFHYSELARAGALRDALGARGAKDKSQRASNKTAIDRQIEELRARWAWRANHLQHPVDLMAEADEEIARAEDRSALLRELAGLERELTDAYRQRRLADPSFAILEQGIVPTLDQVRHLLPEGTALLVFDHVGDDLLSFVVTCDSAQAVALGSLQQLRWDGAALGHALEEVYLFDAPGDVAMLEASLLEDLQALYNAVLARPLARLSPHVQRLILVPDDVLHTLPLEALHDGTGYLLERYAVCYLPAASLLAALTSKSVSTDGRSLLLAHSWGGNLPQAVPGAERVARTLAGHPGSEPLLLVEEQATLQTLRQHAADTRLLHIDAHGAFRDDAPLFSSLHLGDGPLTVHDVYDLDLAQAALVTLSGCQSGVGLGRGGEMLGLTHAFFSAGASALVVSRWQVADEVTARLMVGFYAGLVQGLPVVEALRTAKLDALTSHPHAGYWAAFAVWGRGFDPVFAP